MDELKKLERSADDSLNYILDRIGYDRNFYECDFEYEYSPFEESVKSFCDDY